MLADWCCIDFETASACEIKTAGAERYAEDPTTFIHCLAFKFPGEATQLWKAGEPPPARLAAHVAAGGWVVAHNAGFEYFIWNLVLRNGSYGEWPPLRIEQIDDTMPRARALSLPGGLDDCAAALRLNVRKDQAGYKAMLKLARPRKRDPLTWWTPETAPEDFAKLYAYCPIDVDVGAELHAVLPPLSPTERKLWEIDMHINERGSQLDMRSVYRALELITTEKGELSAKVSEITNGASTATQRDALLAWLQSEGVELTGLTKADVARALADPKLEGTAAKAALQVRKEASKGSTAKLKAMINGACRDGRARGLFSYHGATTGRWCLTADHEVLTPRGWEYLDHWAGGRLMCWDESGRMSFEDATPNSFDYSGDLVCWGNARFQQVATPEHRMPVLGVFGGKPVTAITTKDRMPRTGKAPCSSRYSEVQLRLLIAIQADGCYQENGCVSFNFSKARKVSRCCALLKWAELPFKHRVHRGVTRLEIAKRDVPAWMRDLGDEKSFPWELLFCDHDIFFEELEHWDCYRCGPQSLQYATTNKHNADLVQAKAHISGRSCNVLIKNRGDDRDWADCYYCNIWLTPGASDLRGKHRSTLRFEGKVYCPTTPTGYFLVRRNGVCWITGNSGRRIQTQNMPRPAKGFKPADAEAVMTYLKYPSAAACIRHEYGSVMDAVSWSLRSFIKAAPGHRFITADYSNIEGRVLAWLAGEEWKVEAFREFDTGHGYDLYKLAYAKSFGVPVEQVDDDGQRQIGKVQELALGYSGSIGSFISMGANYGVVPEHIAAAVKAITPADLWNDTLKRLPAPGTRFRAGLEPEVWCGLRIVVDSWRAAHPHVVHFWRALEDAAIEAVEYPGQVINVPGGLVKYRKAGDFLQCKLPSGRCITYPYAEMKRFPSMKWEAKRDELKHREKLLLEPEEIDQGAWSELMAEQAAHEANIEWAASLTYWGVSSKAGSSKKWKQQRAYGGLLAENVTQAVARDCLAEAIPRLEAAGYPVVMHVHDEIVSEVPNSKGDLKEFAHIMCAQNEWAAGLPVVAAGWEGERYRKA